MMSDQDETVEPTELSDEQAKLEEQLKDNPNQAEIRLIAAARERQTRRVRDLFKEDDDE